MSASESQAASERHRSVHRSIVERIVVRGSLVLETPGSFGNGDADAFTDIPIMEDETDGSPLLTGTSIAGALRNYLREREAGYGQPLKGREERSLHAALFGGVSGDDEGGQSPLIVHDALGHEGAIELRDGVKIDGKTRTAEDEKKFDFELLAAGTTFELRFELLISEGADQEQLIKALVTSLDGLAKGEVSLGARKRRGFGSCRVLNWRVTRYQITNRDELLAWLVEGRTEIDGEPGVKPAATKENESIAVALDAETEVLDDKRRSFAIDAHFSLDGSLMIRSGFGGEDSSADMVHLHSKRASGRLPIIPGTSWSGVIRSRATQIVNTLTGGNTSSRIIEGLFGQDVEEKRRREKGKVKHPVHASRVEIAESVISGGKRLSQSRVKLDRFTGGAFESALFDEEPMFGGDDGRVDLKLRLRLPAGLEERRSRAEVGLLLLVFKDLWTADLAVGGEAGIGRGRLRGRKARLEWGDDKWTLGEKEDDQLTVEGDREQLEQCVKDLKEVLSDA